jgi:hypothetical protein
MTDGQEQQWDRRHPDFAPGNAVAVRHGIHSERLTAPLAVAIKEELLADPNLPEYLRQPQFAHSLDAYCWAQGQCIRLREYLAEMELKQALTDRTDTAETEDRDGGRTTRRSISKRLESAHEVARRYEIHAASLRSKLGLDPASAAKLGRNLAAAKLDIATVMAQLANEESDGNRHD